MTLGWIPRNFEKKNLKKPLILTLQAPVMCHYTVRSIPLWTDRPCVAQWLERPLGVREAGVQSPTASHQSLT